MCQSSPTELFYILGLVFYLFIYFLPVYPEFLGQPQWNYSSKTVLFPCPVWAAGGSTGINAMAAHGNEI